MSRPRPHRLAPLWVAALGLAMGCADGTKKAAAPPLPAPAAARDAGTPATADPSANPATPDEARDLIARQLAGQAAPPSGPPQIPLGTGGPASPEPPDPRAGKQITVSGTAANAALGAVVIGADNDTYYLEGLDEWDPELLDQRVEVTGTLQRKKLAPDPTVGPHGEVSHGMQGLATVLERPAWKRLR